jgi:acetyltransferase-like isoleucine patch superfamily enzyme
MIRITLIEDWIQLSSGEIYMICLRYIFARIISIFINFWFIIKSKGLGLGYASRIQLYSRIEGRNKIERFSVFGGVLGYGSYIGANSIVIGKIGRYCSIADKVHFITGTHPTREFVSTHPAFYSLKKQAGFSYVAKQKFEENPKLKNEDYSIIVGNDVYIGYGVVIIGPVRIGDGAVIAANSTVVKDVEPYSIVAGSPAKEIRKRFDSNTIDFLLKFKWWDKDEEWLKKNAEQFSNIEVFKNSNM